MEILISKRFRGQLEDHATVRAYNRLGILAVSAYIFQITATPHGFHQRIQHHHGLGADPKALFVDGTAVGACVCVADLLAVTAVMLRVIPVYPFAFSKISPAALSIALLAATVALLYINATQISFFNENLQFVRNPSFQPQWPTISSPNFCMHNP